MSEKQLFLVQTRGCGAFYVVAGSFDLAADDGGYRIVVTSDYDDEDTNSTPFILHYVHELQLALRLRRIEKEIEL